MSQQTGGGNGCFAALHTHTSPRRSAEKDENLMLCKKMLMLWNPETLEDAFSLERNEAQEMESWNLWKLNSRTNQRRQLREAGASRSA